MRRLSRRFAKIAEFFFPARFGHVARPDSSRTMAAAVYNSHGSADVIDYTSDHARPLRTDGQTLVRIHAAAVNPVDFKMRYHKIPEVVFPLPKIPGTDFAGEVVDTNADSGFVKGDRVFGMMPLLGTPWGSCAEYVSIAHRFIAKAPESIDLIGAASLPLVSLTVMQGLRRATGQWRSPKTRKRILIQAGTGGLGTFAIQYCSRVLGFQVTTTCSPSGAELVRSLGADDVIDYKTESLEERIRDCDFVLDPLGHRYSSRILRSGVLRRGGHYIHVAGSDWPPKAPSHFLPEASPWSLAVSLARQSWLNITTRLGLGNAYYHLVFVYPSRSILSEVSTLVDQGKISPVIDRTFPLASTAAAHEYLQRGHARGKVVLTTDDAN